jgi:hypothetical protein
MDTLVAAIRLVQIFIAIPVIASALGFLWTTANEDYGEPLEANSFVLTVFSTIFCILQFLVWKQTNLTADKVLLILVMFIAFAIGLFGLFLQDKLSRLPRRPR